MGPKSLVVLLREKMDLSWMEDLFLDQDKKEKEKKSWPANFITEEKRPFLHTGRQKKYNHDSQFWVYVSN